MSSSGRNAVFVALALLLLVGTGLAFATDTWTLSPQDLARQLRELGVWAPLAVVLLMVIHSFVPFPGEILAVCAGAVFGVVTGTVLIWVGAMLGALLSFWLSRRLGRSVVESWLSRDSARTMDRWTEDQGTLALLISRFIPIIAFNLINYAAGLTRVSIWTFVWTTGIGILPITILSTYFGSRMQTLDWQTVFLFSAAGIAIVWGLHRLAMSRKWI